MCSVVGCSSWLRGVQRFKLPEDPERRLEWVQFLFEVNGQKLKESSWTDITICKEHFTVDCFVKTVSGTVRLKPCVVPSLCVKSEPEESLENPEHVVSPPTAETGSDCTEILRTTDLSAKEPLEITDEIKECDSPISHTGKSSPATDPPESPGPSDALDSFGSDYSRMVQNIVNVDMIRKKAALLQKKGKYVVNEKRLIQLFSSKCPVCGSKVKVEKFVRGVLLVLNKKCLQCDYRKQWKSQVNARVPAAADKHLIGGTGVTSETASTVDSSSDESDCDAAVEERSDDTDDTEDSGDKGDVQSDDDWNPEGGVSRAEEVYSESDEESTYESDDCYTLAPHHTRLCTDCGKFFNKRKPHTCEHKVKPYSCVICGKRCVSEIALNNHSRIHDENYEFRCKYCHVTFKTKVDKITHEDIHITEGKPYKCPDCEETFATNKERKIHLEDHRGPRLLVCPFCGMEFKRTTPLQRHLTVHTGEKPFKCTVCQRGFSQGSHLKSHMRLHTGERPYKCQHCDKCFNHNVSLKTHVQRYHTSNSAHEQNQKNNRKRNNRNTAGVQGNEKKRDTGVGLGPVVEEQDSEEEALKKTHSTTPKKRSTGRPIGRPKRNATGETMQGQNLNTTASKENTHLLKRTHGSDEESADEQARSDISIELSEGEEESEVKKSDSDSDFDPAEVKKKRRLSQSVQ